MVELVHLGGAPGLAAVGRLGAAGVGPVVEGEGELAQHTCNQLGVSVSHVAPYVYFLLKLPEGKY